MEDEIHYCWSECCDLGPHPCICGNDCEDRESIGGLGGSDDCEHTWASQWTGVICTRCGRKECY